MWVPFRGRIEAAAAARPSSTLTNTNPPTRPPADPDYQVKLHHNQATYLVKQKGGQRPKGVETGQVPRPQATFKSFTQKERYFLYSYVDVLGRNGSGKPPALGGGGDDKAADLFPECSHGGQVLFTITIVDHFLSTLTSPRSCSKNPPSGEVGREQERHRPWSHGSTCE